MARKVEQNPFAVGVLARGAHFADREQEVARIAAAFIEPGARLIVYGDRRLGKSSALERAAQMARAAGMPTAIASLATASDPTEAAQRVLAAVGQEVGRNWRDFLGEIARALQLSIEFDSLTGVPKFGISVEKPEWRGGYFTRVLPDVLTAIDAQMKKRGERVGIGLDEFQRIHEWGGEDAEWALRDALQRHEHVSCVLAGSKKSLIEAMVTDKGRAFWKLADTLAFGPINPDTLAAWITRAAKRTGVRIPPDAARMLVRLAWPRTRDVVQLARAAWFEARELGNAARPELVFSVFDRHVREQAELYRVLWAKLTTREQEILRAFAAEPAVRITASETTRHYRLGPKSSVQSAVERLSEQEHLARRESGEYVFDDPFFRRWVQLYGLPDIGVRTPSLSEWLD